jgi:hypothetical protein
MMLSDMQRRLTIGVSGAIPPALLDALLTGKGPCADAVVRFHKAWPDENNVPRVKVFTHLIYAWPKPRRARQLRAAGAEKVFRETASGARADRAQLRRVLDQLDKGDVLTVTRLARLARSTRDLLNTLATVTGKGAGFRSLHDTWADTTTAHGRLMLAVLGGLAEFGAINSRPHRRRPRTR